MESQGTPGFQAVEVVQRKKRGLWPALALFVVAPLVAEFLLGDFPLSYLPLLLVIAPMYGGGALLIREVVRRTGRGWPNILLLGMAYAIVEEAFTTQSLFNPNYLHLNLGLLKTAFVPQLGIGGWWTLLMLNVHAVWSIATPIALIEATVPDRAETTWLRRPGLIVVVCVFLAGIVLSTTIGYRMDHFMATKAQFAVSAIVVVALAVLAFAIPKSRKERNPGTVPSAWAVGATALLFGSAAELPLLNLGWGEVAILLGLDLAMLGLVLFWSRRAGWALRHKLALAAGAALAYGWHAFVQKAVVPTTALNMRMGNAVFLAGAIALIWLGAKRTSAAERVETITSGELQANT